MPIYKCTKCNKILNKNHIILLAILIVNSHATKKLFMTLDCISDVVSENSISEIAKCNFCEKMYSSISVLYRHQRDNCKIIKQDNEEKKNCFQYLVEQVESLKNC